MTSVGNSRVRKVDIVAGSEKVIVRFGGCFQGSQVDTVRAPVE
jgi:hypothetical protein